LQQDKSGSPEADRVLDQAEEKFYAGEYKDAINLYERVLAIDPLVLCKIVRFQFEDAK
jgi:alkyl sulfatase BDS1-like metallo-beta-lactamase superfamily hydrolase